MSVYKEYSENGELLIEGQFDSKGLKFGLWMEYNRYGTLVIEERYLNGKRHGIYKTYHDNGSLWCTGCFKDGNKEGEFKIYDLSGSLKKIQIYFKDQLFDEWNTLKKL